MLNEQGWLCAYTGRDISPEKCHIEHINAQAHCQRGEDVDYRNLVACYPEATFGHAPYGAHQKEEWPLPNERHLFVSPLNASCEARFSFNYRGHISATNNDEAAIKTIEKLKLDHPELTALRRQAIRGTLQPQNRWLSIEKARTVLKKYEAAVEGRLPPFVFALKQALQKHIKTLENKRKQL